MCAGGALVPGVQVEVREQLVELPFSFCHMGPRLGGKDLYSRSHFTSLTQISSVSFYAVNVLLVNFELHLWLKLYIS